MGFFDGIVLSAACVMAIVLIERNIILAQKSNRGMFVFRVILAVVMAILGSLIIDQIIFAEDIEEERIVLVNEKAKKAYPIKTKELQDQLLRLDSLIQKNEIKKEGLSIELSNNYFIKSTSTEVRRTTSNQSDSVKTEKNTTSTDVLNPRIDDLKNLQSIIAEDKNRRDTIQREMTNLLRDLEKQYGERRGFMDELNILIGVVSKSPASMAVYLMWFFFFFAIELFIVLSKMGETENDYHKLINQQMALHNKRLDSLIR
jgi:hypothetical protein